MMEHFTYTVEFTHPLCPYCSDRVACDQDDPTVPWIGTCKSGHTAIYELDDEDDNS